TDIKYILGTNPLFPVYNPDFTENPHQNFAMEWLPQEAGVYEIGLEHGGAGFRYDNEMGKHKVYLEAYAISNKLVTNKEYVEFMNDGGYKQVLLWHADAWNWLDEAKV